MSGSGLPSLPVPVQRLASSLAVSSPMPSRTPGLQGNRSDMWPLRRNRQPSRELIEVRARREEAERRLAEDKVQVIIPLREIRAKNHVFEAVRDLIQQRHMQGE
jgi:hypothetical protein